MLKLTIPPVLSATDAAPVSAAVAVQGGRLDPASISTALQHLYFSVIGIVQALRQSKELTLDTFTLVGTQGEVTVEMTDTEIRILGAGGVLQRVVTQRQVAPAIPAGFPIAGAAGAAYTGTEQALINTLIAQVNLLELHVVALRANLIAHGLIG